MSSLKQGNLVGIAITSFNYGHYIAEAVQSVVNQTSPNWRLYIYDNGSTDNTFEILAPYLKDDRIELVVHDENIGARKNYEFAFNNIKTKFFSMLCADDFLDNSYVENALDQFKHHPNTPFVFFNWHQYMDDSKDRVIHDRHPFDENRSGLVKISPYLTVCNFVPMHMAVFRTDALEKKFNLLLKSPLNQVGEQYLLKILEDEFGCGCYTGTVGGVWRRHGQQLTSSHSGSGIAEIDEPIERYWYAMNAPAPQSVNVFMALVNAVFLSSRVRYFIAAKWLLTGTGVNYTASFNISLSEKELQRYQGVVLVIAVKYTTYSMIKLCTLDDIKDWLKFMNLPATKLGLKQVLDKCLLSEGEEFINKVEIEHVCHKFFPSEKNIAVIFYLSDIDSWQENGRALKNMAREIDLYISISEGRLQEYSPQILQLFPNAHIYEVPEKNGSAFAFLSIFKGIYSFGYKAIVKLCSTHNNDEKDIYQALLDRCLENEGIIDLFNKNPKLGIYSAIDSLSLLDPADECLFNVERLLPAFDKRIIAQHDVLFTTGSMFWFRPQAFKLLSELDLTIFDDLNLNDDPNIDRAFGLVCKIEGYSNVDRLSKYEDQMYLGWLESKRESNLAYGLPVLSGTVEPAPLIHLLMFIDGSNLALLADTLDSLGGGAYTHWHLSIISFLPCPDDLFDEMAQVDWVTIEQKTLNFQDVLQATAVQSHWLGFLEAGDYLEPYALWFFSEYINKDCSWKVIYTDEDRISEDGFFHNPKFKPDFNLDFLYSVDYLGGLVLFKTEHLNQLGEISFLTPVISYDLVLNYLDLFGEQSIGHIAEISVHRKEYVDELTLSQTEIRQHVLREHFKRNNSEAVIEQGFQQGSFYIKFPVNQQALISIVISTKNELEFLRQCVGSIIDNTTYENYELIIVDNRSDDSELLSYLNDLDENDSRIRLISPPLESNYAEINNLAVEQAAGSYVVLLNNDTVVLQDEWLQGMLSNLQRENVGVVGARLVSPHKKIEHAGLVLGMGVDGVAKQPHIGLSMGEHGYMGRAMATQEFSAVSSACLMIEKKLYQSVSGLDEKLSNILFSDVDLCLKLKDQGYKVVWVPYVTLIHHGLRYHQKAELDNKRQQQSEKEKDIMLGKWLPQLAADPAYNRNLSLKTTDFQVDKSLNVSWCTDYKEKPKVYAFPPDSAGVGEYRVRGPVNTLTRAGLIEGAFANNVNELILPTVVEIERIKPDVLFMQNGFLDFMLTAWKKYRKFNDVFMVCGQDDIVYMLPEDHPMKGEWPTNLRRKVKEQFQCSDRLIVANEALAAEFKKMAGDIVVVPNYLENIRWDSLLLPEKNTAKKLRVGWAGGQQHENDLKFILPIVEALYKEVDWVFMGLCLEELEPFVKEIHKGVTFDLYPQKLAELNLDLAIAPLMHNKFNECKTNLRLLEYGILGWAVVCSDVLPYQDAPVTRVANNTQHWIKTIREKINEPEALVLEGEALKKWVVDNYMLDDHVDEWYAALMP